MKKRNKTEHAASGADEKEQSTMFDPNNPYNQGPQNNPYNPSNQYNPNNPYGQFPQSGPSNWNGPGSRYNRYRRPRRLGGCIIGLVILVILAITFFVFQHFRNQPPAFFFQGDLFSINTLLIPGIVIIGLLILLAAIARVFRGSLLGKLVGGLFTLILCLIIGVFAFWSALINPNIGMTRTGFTRASVSISTGDTINFRNPGDGVTQILCVGVDQQCQSEDGDPVQLDGGLVIQPGQIVSVTFDEEGDYQITSKTTPNMNISIDVTTPDDSGD